MINPFFKPVKIYCRTKLADFEEADQNIATSEPKGATPTQGSRESQFEQRDYSQLPELSDSVLSDSDRVKFQTLFKKFRDVFAFPGDQLAGRTSLVQHVIDTGDAVPIKQRPYRTSPEGKKEIDRQVQDMRGKEIIQESVSPQSAPVVLVKKKNGDFGFCIDFRAINKVTKKDSFPMPLVADALDSLAGTNVYSTLDCKSG